MTAHRRLNDPIAHWARATPEAEALVLNETRMSYRALNDRIDALAKAMLAAGIVKGDRVATLQTPHPDFILVLLAAASIGAIWVGLNPRYRREEMAHVLVDSTPRLLFTRSRIEERDYAPDISALREAAPSVERVIVFDSDPPLEGALTLSEFIAHGASVTDAALAAARADCGGRDPCLIVYTSGSTGKPKGALLHHEGILWFCAEQNRLWPASPVRAVNYFPINHVGCIVDLSMPTLAAGGTIIFMEAFDPEACLALMERERVTLWGSVPSVFQMQLALPDFARFDLSAVQLIVWGGAAMPEELVYRLRAIHPRLATNYGMTETTSAITALAPTDDVEALAHSVGEVFPGVEIRLVAESGAEAGVDETGEIWVRSPGNLLGYWNRPDAESLTPEGFFRTGDLAVRRADGRYRIVGRLKEMYKSGGYNVYPREVEAVLEDHPGVALAAVVAAPDPLWQEVGIAYVIPRGPLNAEALEAYCRARLANYKVPKRIVIEAELPLLPIGKIDKAALKARAQREA